MADWLAANLQDRAAHGAICDADRVQGPQVLLGWKMFGDGRDAAINAAAFAAWGSLLRLAIHLAREGDVALDRVAIRDVIHQRVGDAIVSTLADFGLLKLLTFAVEPCQACGGADCEASFCERKRRKAEQQAKAQAMAARAGVTGDVR